MAVRQRKYLHDVWFQGVCFPRYQQDQPNVLWLLFGERPKQRGDGITLVIALSVIEQQDVIAGNVFRFWTTNNAG